MIFSPLEQFELVPILSIRIGSFDFSFTNASLFIFFSLFFILVFTNLVSFNGNGFLIPNRWQYVFESFFLFIENIVQENIGVKGQKYFSFIFCLFIFLLICNTIGLVPYSFTVTSHFIVTFSLSILVWVGKLFIGFKHHGLKLFGVLLPSGIPFAIVPFFIIVEFLSFFIPLVALGVRLFANIIAGHILLKVIVGFCWSIIIIGGLFFLAHFIPMGVLFLLLFLETAVAFIQAYVFTMLACLITGDIIKGGH
uniref:ATP synthase subunit a n=1 Tax=Thraustochytrium aureum TaxID=42467 RepID=Q9G4D7_9STRA|nr:ATP synthase F0 subunit 6 [Thraustochytrium aureum]